MILTPSIIYMITLIKINIKLKNEGIATKEFCSISGKTEVSSREHCSPYEVP